MLVPETTSMVDQIHSRLNAISQKLVDLPEDLRDQIEEDLQNIRSCVGNGALSASAIRHRELAESINDGFLELDRDWRFTYVNQRAANNVGYSPENLVGKNMWDIFPSLLGTPAEKVIRQVMEQRQPASIEVAGTLSGRFYNNRVYPSSDGIIIFWIDITEQKKAEKILRESEAKMQAVFQALSEGVVFLNTNGEVEEINRSVEHNFGHTLQELTDPQLDPRSRIIRPDGSLFPVDEQPAIVALRTGQAVHNVEMGVPTLDGNIHWRLVNAEPVFNDQGTLLGAVVSLCDISERKRAEEALISSNRKISEILSSIRDDFYVLDRNWKFVYANKQFTRRIGKEPEDFIGNCIWEMFPKHVGSPLYEKFHASMEKGEIQRFELGGQYTDAWYSMTSFPSTEGITVLGSDITERKRAEDALKRVHDQAIYDRNRLLAVMEALPIGLAILDEKGGNIQSNRAYEDLWRGSRPAVHSIDDYAAYQAWWVDTGKPVQPEEWASAQAVQKGETVVGQLMEIQRFDGTRAFVVNSGAPFRDPDGKILGCAVAILDITEQKRLENEQREHLIQMEIQTRLLDYREQERQALARELHDGPVQNLSSLLFNVQFAKGAISDLPMKLELDKIASGLRDTVQDLRDMINEMRPPSLIRFGFAKAMDVFLEEFREKHPEIQMNATLMDDAGCLSESRRLSLFRIVQETLTNILKHSGAARIDVILACEDHQVTLEIRDDGKGFSLSQNFIEYSSCGQYGLVGMKERADAIGAAFRVHSSPGEGTTINVIVPINHS